MVCKGLLPAVLFKKIIKEGKINVIIPSPPSPRVYVCTLFLIITRVRMLLRISFGSLLDPLHCNENG